MSSGMDEFARSGGLNQQQIVETLAGKVFAAADTRAVYGEPVAVGGYTVITASEVSSGGGGGSGGGFGPAPQEVAEGEAGEAPATGPAAGGSGTGMGGGAFGRPVAVVVIGPDGVEIKPVFDVTKIGLAFATAFGGMLLMWGQMRRAALRPPR